MDIHTATLLQTTWTPTQTLYYKQHGHTHSHCTTNNMDIHTVTVLQTTCTPTQPPCYKQHGHPHRHCTTNNMYINTAAVPTSMFSLDLSLSPCRPARRIPMWSSRSTLDVSVSSFGGGRSTEDMRGELC
ncbi:hypothetical protein ElyMa_001630400 [Elysia marginata]|uniref:Uncharacterized protein n=1 Tax=Elysia marginata TaxID=1093978 RepID=A0AAV4JMT8_9GAST|nr:hypothetical protein ElyMa_001630400 [Elysia marginata]